MYKIEYYQDAKGTPVFKYIEKQSPKTRAKLLRDIDLLEKFGLGLGFPHISNIKKGIWELRIKHQGNHRVLFFHFSIGQFILLNAFLKKTQKTPDREISIAIKRKQLYLKKKGDYR